MKLLPSVNTSKSGSPKGTLIKSEQLLNDLHKSYIGLQAWVTQRGGEQCGWVQGRQSLNHIRIIK